jgi:EAL domain-containing protein (putative c-di-GMP-specific phosphodiesterase class I)
VTMRMLVFDDEAAIGRLVVRVGALVGLEAISVVDADAFRRSLLVSPPQIVVLDLQLGTTDGVEQMRFLAEQRYTDSLILMSGFDPRVLQATATVARSFGLNVEAALVKPIRLKELEQILERLRSAEQPITLDALLAAIRNNELILEFQPIVTRQPRALRKLEALVRWNHPSLGRVPPDEFLPVAEACREAIDALTDWVIDAAVNAWQILHKTGLTVPISVNVSTLNLHDLTLPDRVARRMEASLMPTACLCLEITETAASRDTGRMMDILTRMRLKGMELAIDDFGTGYSSLKVLRQLPFSEIKIDRSFVADMATSRDSRTIVKSIIDLAVNMEMRIVAEGVDSEDAAHLLEQMNVYALQGYLIARPMQVDAVAAWLAAWTQSTSPTPVPDEVTPPLVTRRHEEIGLETFVAS